MLRCKNKNHKFKQSYERNIFAAQYYHYVMVKTDKDTRH